MKLLPTFAEDHSARTASLKQTSGETIGETYLEEDPSVAEWFRGLVPTKHGAAEYVRELFPSARWMRRYNLQWLAGDAIAGKYHCKRFLLGLILTPERHYSWPRCSSPSHGICVTRAIVACVWSLHNVHRCMCLLDIWHIQRYRNRRKSSL
jgi:sodium-independent sulfate anion transporter 11